MSANKDTYLVELIKKEKEALSAITIQLDDKLAAINEVISQYDSIRSKKNYKEAFASIQPGQFFIVSAVIQNIDTDDWYKYEDLVDALKPIAQMLNNLSLSEIETFKNLLDEYNFPDEQKAIICNNEKIRKIFEEIFLKEKTHNIKESLSIFTIFLNDSIFCRKEMPQISIFSPIENKRLSDSDSHESIIVRVDSENQIIFNFTMLREATRNIRAHKRAFDKNLSMILRRLNEAIEEVEKVKNQGIRMDKDFIRFLSPRLILAFEYYNAEIFNISFRDLIARNEELEEEVFDHLKIIFSKYKINVKSFSDETRELLEKCDVDHLESCLKIFVDNGFSLVEFLNNGLAIIIANSSIETINSIIDLINKKVLSVAFVSNNIGILLAKKVENSLGIKPLYPMVINNDTLLKKYNKDYQKEYYYNPSLLLIDSDILGTNIQLYFSYIKYIKSFNIQLLSQKNAFDLIDYFIEKGYDTNILSSIDLSRIDIITIINRLEVALYAESVMTNSVILSCFSDKFYVSQLLAVNPADSYIVNESDKEMDQTLKSILEENDTGIISNQITKYYPIKMLDQNFLDVDDKTYDFEGISISRNKILRRLEVLVKYRSAEINIYQLLLNAIIYKSILNSDEVAKIKSCLNDLNLSDTRSYRY